MSRFSLLATIFTLLLLGSFSAREASAKRSGALLIQIQNEYYLSPTSLENRLSQAQIYVGLGYRLKPSLMLAIGFESDLNTSNLDPIERGFSSELRYTHAPHRAISPQLYAGALYIFETEVADSSDTQAFGLRAGGGVRVDLFQSTGADGFFFNFTPGVRTMFFKEIGTVISIEWLRAGVEYAF